MDEYPIEWPHQGKTIYHGTGGFEASIIAKRGLEVPTHSSGRGNDFGLALYFTTEKDWAEDYSRGAMVTARLKPEARILDIAYAWSAGLTDRSYESFTGDWWKQYALDNGYHGITTEGEIIAIYDASVVTLLSVRDDLGRGELLATVASLPGGDGTEWWEDDEGRMVYTNPFYDPTAGDAFPHGPRQDVMREVSLRDIRHQQEFLRTPLVQFQNVPTSDPSEPVILTEAADGSYIVIDGHHRLALAALRGVQTVMAKVWIAREAKVAALGGPDAGSAADLKRTDLFWRVHDSDRPFEASDATSQPFINMTNPENHHADEGYSAVRSPVTLVGYLVTMGWISSDGGVVYDDDVIGFRGRVVGTGPDGEDLVIPEGGPVYRASFHDFVDEFENTTCPKPTQDRISFLDWRGIIGALLPMQGYDMLAWPIGEALDIDVDDVARDLWGDDYEMAMYGSRTASYQQDGVPPPPGETPLPSGHVRLFHVTRRPSLDSILRNGLTVSNAQGSTYGEPNLVWASAGLSYWTDMVETDAVMVEFSVPFDEIEGDLGIVGSPSHGETPQSWMDKGGNIAFPYSIPTSRFLAVHEGWHNAYRSLQEYGKQEVLDGEYDNFLDGSTPEHAKAIERIKREGVRQRFTFEVGQYTDKMGTPVYIRHAYVGESGLVWASHSEQAIDSDDPEVIGALRWTYETDPPTVADLHVEKGHRGEGIATLLWQHAKSLVSSIEHSDSVTGDGQRWIDSLGARDAATTGPASQREASLPVNAPGVYWRVHDESARGPLVPWDAVSRPLYRVDGNTEVEWTDEEAAAAGLVQEGYSAVASPWALLAYVGMNHWGGQVENDHVYAFEGRRTDIGVDGEPLVEPTGRVLYRKPWRDFLLDMVHAPAPDKTLREDFWGRYETWEDLVTQALRGQNHPLVQRAKDIDRVMNFDGAEPPDLLFYGDEGYAATPARMWNQRQYSASRTAAKGDYQIVELDVSDVSTTRCVALVLDEGDEERNWMLPQGQMYRLAGFLTFDDQTMTTELAYTVEEGRRKGVQTRLWDAAERLVGGVLRPHGMHSPAGTGLARSRYEGPIDGYREITQGEADGMAERFMRSIGAAIGFIGDSRIKQVLVQRVGVRHEAVRSPQTDGLPEGFWVDVKDRGAYGTFVFYLRGSDGGGPLTYGGGSWGYMDVVVSDGGMGIYLARANTHSSLRGRGVGVAMAEAGLALLAQEEFVFLDAEWRGEGDGNTEAGNGLINALQRRSQQRWGSTSQQRTAAWSDVVKKAARIRQDGGVRIISTPEKGSSNQDWVIADVRGDTNVYRTELMRVAGSRSTALWRCGCAWAAYSWGRSGRWKKYEGRMCSHALAVQYEMQARTGFDGSEPAYEDPAPKDWGKGVEPQFEHDKGPLPADKGFV